MPTPKSPKHLAVRILAFTSLLSGALVSANAQPFENPADPLLARAVWLSVEVETDTTQQVVRITPIDPWFGRDKALHVSVSFLLTLSGQYFLVSKADFSEGNALPISAATALSIGLLKEIMDSQRPRNPHFSWRDMAANAVGVGIGALLIVL